MLVLVTVGSTEFPALVNAALQAVPEFLDGVPRRRMVVQHGSGPAPSRELIMSAAATVPNLLCLGHIASRAYMTLLSSADVVIAHAGVGSLVEALRARRYVIAVPNSALMNNHQLELIEAMRPYLLAVCMSPTPEALSAALRLAWPRALARFSRHLTSEINVGRKPLLSSQAAGTSKRTPVASSLARETPARGGNPPGRRSAGGSSSTAISNCGQNIENRAGVRAANDDGDKSGSCVGPLLTGDACTNKDDAALRSELTLLSGKLGALGPIIEEEPEAFPKQIESRFVDLFDDFLRADSDLLDSSQE